VTPDSQGVCGTASTRCRRPRAHRLIHLPSTWVVARIAARGYAAQRRNSASTATRRWQRGPCARFSSGSAAPGVQDDKRFYGPFHDAAETVPRTVPPGRELRAPDRRAGRGLWSGGGGDHTPPPCGSFTVGLCGHHPRFLGAGCSSGRGACGVQQLIRQPKLRAAASPSE
jgi:hypothetical protein